MIELREYREVPEHCVSAGEVRLARQVRDLAAQELRLGGVRIAWCTPAHRADARAPWREPFLQYADLRGMVRRTHPGTIVLVAPAPLAHLARTVAHECRHLHQAARHGDWRGWWDECSARERAAQEADAAEWAERFARRLGW